MKQNWQFQHWVQSALVGVGLTCSVNMAQAVPDRVLGTFDFDTTGWGTAWGAATAVFDPTQDNTGNGGGSCYISADFAADQNTLTIYGVVEGNPWWHPTGLSFNMSDYKSLEFDIKWDTVNSTLSIADFNSPPLGGEGNITIWAVDYSDFNDRPTLGNVPVPEAAASGWVHVSLPINPTISGIDPSKGIVFKKWITPAQKTAGGTYAFWVDNVILKGTDAPPPPPSLSFDKPVPGLAFVAASGGQWDRQEIRTVASNYTWIGASGPVSYSVDVSKIADNAHAGFQLFLHFVPGGADPNRPDSDWHEPNVLMWQIGNLADGAAWSTLRYKTNSPESNGHLYDTGDIGGVWNPTVQGTWTITFSDNTNVTITTPAGNTLVTNLPPEVISIFSATPGMQVNVGGVPNSLDRLGQMAVITRVQFTGTPAELNSNFLGVPRDTNVWNIVASSPTWGVQEIPTDAVYWLKWTLPAQGFSLLQSASLTGPWTGSSLPGYEIAGFHYVLLRTGDLPGANSGFFRLMKRQFSKLQVLLPGETAAPGTPTGKTGTPDPQTAWMPFSITVNAVDNEWYPIAGINDVVHITTDDPVGVLPSDLPLANGTVTFTDCVLGTAGTWRITASDVTDATKGSGTSSPIVVQ